MLYYFKNALDWVEIDLKMMKTFKKYANLSQICTFEFMSTSGRPRAWDYCSWPTRGLFHQHFTISFYNGRHRRRKKTQWFDRFFAVLAFACVKALSIFVSEIDPYNPSNSYSKAALRRAFYACVYCMWLRFPSNFLGWPKPRLLLGKRNYMQ